MDQDLNPLPWGAQDRYQAHFIVRTKKGGNLDYFLARTKIETTGHFSKRSVSKVEWVGEEFANILNSDEELKAMILRLPYKDAFIWVDPTKTGIRIRGKWKSSQDMAISKELFEVYDRIASYIKRQS